MRSTSTPPTIPAWNPPRDTATYERSAKSPCGSPTTSAATWPAPESPCQTGWAPRTGGALTHGVDLDELTDASDPDGAAKRERAREEKAEKERAERRKLIALNKLGQ